MHPTQIYESIAGLLFFYYLWKQRLKIKTPGSLFFTYLVLAGMERFLVEFIRTNEKYFFDIFSGAQMISFLMVLIGSYFLLYPTTNIINEKVS